MTSVSRLITFKSAGKINLSLDKQKLGGFIAARNVKEVFQAANNLGQKLESTQKRKNTREEINERKIEFFAFTLHCSKRKVFKTVTVTVQCNKG